ncbi:MAG: ABC transporter substrate-binding protein [Myxococcota bacterium]
MLLALALVVTPVSNQEIDAVLAKIEAQARVALSAQGSPKDLRHLLGSALDFDALAAYALDPEWSQLSDKQRRRFVTLLQEVVVLQVESRIERPIEFTVQVTRKQQAAEYVGVFAVVNPEAPDPIHLTLTLRKQERWRVVDISVDGSSLAKGYRDEFLGLLTRVGFKAMLRALSDKKKNLSR